jgi:ribA/ribD-fused uncharacterized protein
MPAGSVLRGVFVFAIMLVVRCSSTILLDHVNATKPLVEASPYDLIWGVGLGEHHPDVTDKSKWRGLNLLGQALMKVRDTHST